MSVTCLRDGRWIVQHRDQGRTVRRYFGRGPEAEARARQLQAEIGLRRYAPRSRPGITFRDLTQAYLDARATAMEESSLDRLFVKLDTRIMPALGTLPAAAISAEVIDAYVQMRSGKVKRTTIRVEVTAIVAILRWGVRRKMLAVNPLEGYEKPSRDDQVIDPPSPEEVTRIWEVAAAHLKRIISMCWFLGLRAGNEVLSLKWDAVDFAAGSIIIESAKKHGLRSRRLALHPVLLAWMREWWEIDQAAGLRHIVTFRGQRIRNPYNAWREAKRKAGITRRIRLYDLRHAFATGLIMDGEDPRTVSKLMGHTDVSTTLRVYTHVTRAAQVRAIDRIKPIGNGFIKSLPE